MSKLYTCLDLKKYDEAVQACDTLLDFAAQKSGTAGAVPEEKCIRAIVGGSMDEYGKAQERHDSVALDSARRTLSRVYDLLNRLSTATTNSRSGDNSKAWIWETLAYLNEFLGRDEQVLENRMKEYRALMQQSGWERDQSQIAKVIEVVTLLVQLLSQGKGKDQQQRSTKARYLVKSVLSKIDKVYFDKSKIPQQVKVLRSLQEDLSK